TAMLPNGKVLMWDSVGDGPAEGSDDQSFTRAAVWDPLTNTGRRVDVKGYNIFCAGFTQLADGMVLVAGGNRDKALHGLRTTHLFDWRTETWRRGPDMHAERWYPSVAALPNQEALITGGGPATPEVFQTNQWVRLLTGIATTASRLYPLLTVRPDGNVDIVGPWATMQTLRTSAAGGVVATTIRDTITRDYASFAMFRPGRTLVSGGGILDEAGLTKVPTRTAMIIGSTTAGAAPTSRQTRPMAFPRRQHNLTILADGNVLATGGESSAAVSSLVDLNHAVFNAELFDTGNETWRTLGAANRVREYHSTAILLPDGRVMTGGGGICGVCQQVGYLEKNVEYFEPPYLFRTDGSGAHADRPVIGSAPASAGYNTSYSVTSAQAASIAKVGLVRMGAPTHGDDQGQRYVPAAFTRSATTLTVRSPANVNQAPPGYYMLFIVDAAGVPSVAKFVRLTATAPAAPAPVRVMINRPGGRCVDVDHSVFAPGTRIQMWDCNATTAQRWSRAPDAT
ncbi:MAG TPA: galactose oxidase-like domain-containing protein, partial [Kribbellaceae bacterium]